MVDIVLFSGLIWTILSTQKQGFFKCFFVNKFPLLFLKRHILLVFFYLFNSCLPLEWKQTSVASTSWEVSKYRVFSGPYFPVVNLRIQSEYGKIRTRKNSVFRHLSHSVATFENSDLEITNQLLKFFFCCFWAWTLSNLVAYKKM